VTGIFSAIAPAGVFYPLFVLLLALGLGARGLVRHAAGGARWDQLVRRLERLALTVLLLAMLGFGVLQIVLRNLFHTGLVWIDPLLRHLVLWIGFTAAVVAAGRLRHIQMDVVGRLLPAGPRLWVLRLTTLAAAIVCMVLARAAWVYLGQEHEFGSTGFLSIPIWLLQVVVFIGFALLAKRFFTRALLPSRELAAIAREGHEAAEGEQAPPAPNAEAAATPDGGSGDGG
jgi:TRAP-type C4-dicarboxylate transport system permease small subunit